MQVQSPSTINDRQEYETLGIDISCNLASTNVVNLMNSDNFGESVETMFRGLTNVSEMLDLKTVPTIEKGNDVNRAVGLGVMNLAGYLAKNHIMYGSEESIEFTGLYFMLLNYWTLVASNKLAKEKNETFYQFDKSEYANGKYFERYKERIRTKEDIKFDKNTDAFEDIFIPSHDDWKELQESIEKHGLYNSYRIAVAPTGSISYINEATSSIHPIIQKIEDRLEKGRGKVYYPAPYIEEEGVLEHYESAYDIDQRKIMDIYSEAQKHVDQGLSMTLYTRQTFPEGMYEWKEGTAFPQARTSRDLNIFRNYAYAKNIKSIYYIRTMRDNDEEVDVNMCESCVI